MKTFILAATALGLATTATAQTKPAYDASVFAAAKAIQPKVVAWRRDIHEHPELSTQEVRTAKLIADELTRLGYEVRTGVAGTGVIGILKGGRPGKTVALRADMDALPVLEQTGLPFASKATGTYNGQTVPIMHACGHDAHVAMLLGAAEVLAGMKAQIPGTVVLLFQPAEEGAPTGVEGGAPLVMKENALSNPKPDAIFGIHVFPGEVGSLVWRPGPFMAASDTWETTVKGKQAHGAQPWEGIDASSVAADIVTAFNQITSRQVQVTRTPTILTVGEIHLGTRHNIVPETFQMRGTLRTFDPKMRTDVVGRIEKTVNSISERYGAKADFRWVSSNPVTSNDPALSAKMKPTLQRASEGKARDDVDFITGSEDFSYYQSVAPTMFYHLGIGAPAGGNHSPFFTVDERALETGVRAHVLSALDFLNGK